MKISPSLFRALSSMALLLLVPACRNSTHLSTLSAGHAILAEIDGSHSLDSQDDHAVIASEFGRITVERTRVQLGDGPWTKIPEGVPIDVGISKHKRWVIAGPVSIKETSR